jgi:predicted phosphoribosyltransferase
MLIYTLMDKSPYFESRLTVGKDLAEQIAKFDYKDTAILALSPGGVVIAAQIASKLHNDVNMLLLKHVYLPDGKTAIGIMNENGWFTYDDSISVSQVEEFEIEYRNSLEASRMEAVHQLHAINHKGSIDAHKFKNKNVVIVNDFARTGTAFHAALDFLKPIKTKSIILVTAVSQLKAIDVMHHLGDRLFIAHATDKDFPPEHYFAENIVPDTETLLSIMKQ